MRRYVFRFAMLTLAVLGPGTVRGDDQEIAAQIIEKLQAEKQAGTLKGFSIDMQVDEGTVWLSGRVATATQHHRRRQVLGHRQPEGVERGEAESDDLGMDEQLPRVADVE